MLCRGPAHYLMDPFGWRLPRRSLVLDVGSGQKPMWRADVLVERFLDDDTGRPGRLLVARPLVCADLARMPFEDKTFDFVYCSHVFEHVEDPDAAARELGRVAHAGVIAVPSDRWEREADCPEHRWVYFERDGVLQYMPKPDDVTLIDPQTEGPEVVHLWQGTPRLVGLPCPGERRKVFYQETRRSAVRHLARRLMVAAGTALHAIFSAHLRPDVLCLLRCLACQGGVTRVSDGSLSCTHCGRTYPLRGGIPIMLGQDVDHR